MASPPRMNALRFDTYGSFDALRVTTFDRPSVRDDRVLVRVHAASINAWDCEIVRGEPYANRLAWGLTRPTRHILGADIAGRVEAVGPRVKRFKPGDEVFGDLSGCGFGGFAEFVSARESALTFKPATLSFTEAAAVPQAASMALQALRDKVRLRAGDRVLVNGAGGGVGTYAVQMARAFGATVTAVDAAEKLDLLRSLGATHVLDYARDDFTKTGHEYELIVDVAMHRSVFACRPALAPGGTYVMVGGSTGVLLEAAVFSPLFSPREGKTRFVLLIAEANRDLEYIKAMLRAGDVKPVIDRTYTLDEAPDALRYVGAGRARGKVVLEIQRA